MKIAKLLNQIIIAIIGVFIDNSHSKDRYKHMRDFEIEIEKRRNEQHY